MNTKVTTGLHNSGTTTQLEQTVSNPYKPISTEDVFSCRRNPFLQDVQIYPYLYKLAGISRYSVGQYRCRTHSSDLITISTRDSREMVADIWIGKCCLHGFRQAYSVHITPSDRLASLPCTQSDRVGGDYTEPQRDRRRQGGATSGNSSKLRAIGGARPVLSLSNLGASVATPELTTVLGGDNE